MEIDDIIKGSLDDALKSIDQLISNNPNDTIKYQLMKSDIYNFHGEYNKGLELALEVKNQEPNNEEKLYALVLLVEISDKLAKFNMVEKFFHDAECIIKNNDNYEIDKLKCRLYRNWGRTCSRLGNYDTGLEYLEQALVTCEQLNDNHELAAILNNMGINYWYKGDLDKTLDYYNKALAILLINGDQKEIARIKANLASIHWDKGDLDQSLSYLQEALKIFEEFGDPQEISTTLNNIGIIFKDMGELDSALQYYKLALEMRLNIGNQQYIAISFSNIGFAYKDKGELELALDYYDKALKIFNEIGNNKDIASTLGRIGSVYNEKGELEQALEYYEKSLTIFEEIGNQKDIATTLNDIGRVYFSMGEYSIAMKYFLDSLDIFLDQELVLYLPRIYFNLIRIHIELDNIDKANQYSEKLNDISQTKHDLRTSHLNKMATALQLKTSKRLSKKMSAQPIFEEIMNAAISDYNLTILAMVNYCELLLLEFNTLKEEDVLQEIIALSERIYTMAQNNKIYPLMIKSLFLIAKLHQIEFKFDMVEETLQEAYLLTIDKNLATFQYQVEAEKKKFEEEITLWYELAQASAPLIERTSRIEISSYLNDIGKSMQTV
ncbi:MAG: DUF2225 domain-containing protein [Candidatus Heimdallarchaeota archaeon]|nr:DUF2225 domain-containing protein [Candidatus Heimdallarchaeota archaeon]